MFKEYRTAYDEMQIDPDVLAARHAVDVLQEKLIEANQELAEVEEEYRERMKEAEADIIDAVLKSEQTTTLFGVVAKYFKGRKSTSWKSVAEDLFAPEALIEEHTKIGNPRVTVEVE